MLARADEVRFEVQQPMAFVLQVLGPAVCQSTAAHDHGRASVGAPQSVQPSQVFSAPLILAQPCD